MSLPGWNHLSRMDELSRLDTPAHRLDPRATALATLGFVAVVMSFPARTVSALTPLALYPLGMMAAGRIPARWIARGLAAAAPFALAVAAVHPFLDRTPAMRVGPVTLTGGWLTLFSIMARFLLTVGAVLVVAACTGMHRLGAGLERMRVPRAFVTQLLMLYRYLFVLAGEAGRMARSASLRGGGAALRLRAWAPLVGCLLLRALDRADRVHRAMVARGFDGEIRLARPLRFRPSDWVFTAACAALFMAARRWNLAAGLGRLAEALGS